MRRKSWNPEPKAYNLLDSCNAQCWVSTNMSLTLSLPRVIIFKLPLQPHQNYNVTRYEELGFSQLTQMKDDYYYHFSLTHLYISLQ